MILPDTILIDTIEKLKNHLTTLYKEYKNKESNCVTTEKKIKYGEYAHGIKDALELVSLHIAQSRKTIKPSSPHTPEKDKKPKKLCHMFAEDIVKFTRDPSQSNLFKTTSMEDLIETAFKFENEMMQILGDENTIAFDAYADLSTEQLIRIIKNSVEKIIEIKN